MQSGTSLNLPFLTRKPRKFALAVGSILNANLTNSQSLVDDLRKVNYQQLQSAQTNVILISPIIESPFEGLAFAPTVEFPHPGAVVVNRSHELLKKGLFNRVPYIIGYNSEELRGSSDELNKLTLIVLKFILGPTFLVPVSMNMHNIFTKAYVNNLIKTRYFKNPLTITNEEVGQFLSDDAFVRPGLEAVRLYSRYSPVYLYRFSYAGYLGSGNRTTREGVGHVEELPYFWNQSKILRNPTPSDLVTRRRLIKLWTNFARFGNPTPESDTLLQNVIWPLASEQGGNNLAFLNIDTNLTAGVNPNWDEFIFWKNLFDKFGNPPYDTY